MEREPHVALCEQLVLGSIVVVEVVGPFEPAAATWPCPGCGAGRPTQGAVVLRIRNEVGPAFERPVAVCAACLAALEAAGALGTAGGRDSPRALA